MERDRLNALADDVYEQLYGPLENKGRSNRSVEEEAARKVYLDAFSFLANASEGDDLRAEIEEQISSKQGDIEQVNELVESAKRLGKADVDMFVLSMLASLRSRPSSPYIAGKVGSLSSGFGLHRSPNRSSLDHSSSSKSSSAVPAATISSNSAAGFVEAMLRYDRAGMEASRRVLALLDKYE